jgi:2-keto-4-pentenoate hydratase/2-oxohepta-3-ene-1,7-dioic acid hydratase in catechol pathway
MRLVTYTLDGGPMRSGALIDSDHSVLDLAGAFETVYGERSPHLASIQTMAEAPGLALEQAAAVLAKAPAAAIHARSAVHLKAPIQPPAQMRDLSCFELHLKQSFAAARRFSVRKEADPEAAYASADTSLEDQVIATYKRQPIYYKANRFAVIGHDDDFIWPRYCRALDFELEWGCYIGQPGKDVAAADAAAHIFGYTVFNDFTARDAQAREMSGQLGPAKGKDFDTANVMGPCLVTPDELGDPYDLDMICRVNGDEWGRGSTGDMGWSFEDAIAHITQSETLHSGEFLGSGTVGNGSGLERGMTYLKPGDIVELEVAKIGVLRTLVNGPA